MRLLIAIFKFLFKKEPTASENARNMLRGNEKK